MNVGDVYSFHDEWLGAYHVCQVTGFEERTGEPSVLLLDWSEKRPPEPADLSALKPHAQWYHGWNGDAWHNYVRNPLPADFACCGNIPPLLPSKDVRSYTFAWPNGYVFIRKLRWDRIPEHFRTAYKTAAPKDRSMSEDDPALADFKGFSVLDRHPAISTLIWSGYSEEMHEHLKTHPLISELQLRGVQPERLDFRGTFLTNITVNANGVKEIWIGDDFDSLMLTGPLQEGFSVRDPNQGHYLLLRISGEYRNFPPGLDRLRALNLFGIREIDIAVLVRQYPALSSVHLSGKLGDVKNIPALGALKDLSSIWMSDLYGYSGEDFPAPDVFPKLRNLHIWGLPADAAKTIKTMYQPLAATGAFQLEIKQPRKPEWLAQNKDNPFRDWDGDDGVPPSCAKKASDQYRKTRKGLMDACGSGGSEEEITATCTELCRDYILAFNKMDRTGFIDTVLREQIIEILETLLDDVKVQTGAAIDTASLVDGCDRVRDW
jgi:hypothetical protein